MVVGVEEAPRLESIIVMELVKVAVELVGTALDHNVDRGSPRQPLVRIKTIGRHVHRLDGVGRRDVSDVLRDPDIVLAHAVNANIIAVAAGAVHIELERARRVGGNGVGADRRIESGNRSEQLFEVVPGRHRHVLNGRRGQVMMDVGALGLKYRRGCGHFHTLVYCTQFESGVYARGRINGHVHARLGRSFEALG